MIRSWHSSSAPPGFRRTEPGRDPQQAQRHQHQTLARRLASSLIGLGGGAALAGLECRAEQRTAGQRLGPDQRAAASAASAAGRYPGGDGATDAGRSAKGERRRDAEQRLLDLPVVDAHLNVRGRAVPDTSRPGPLNFAALVCCSVRKPAPPRPLQSRQPLAAVQRRRPARRRSAGDSRHAAAGD